MTWTRTSGLFAVAIAPLLLAAGSTALALGACSSTDGAVGGADDAGRTTPAVNGDDAASGDAAPDASDPGDAAVGCKSVLELKSISGTALTAHWTGATEETIRAPLANRSPTLVLTVVGRGSTSSLQGATVTLGRGAEANVRTCTHCALLGEECIVGQTVSCARWYFARSGTSVFSHAGSSAPSFAGSFDEVMLEEVKLASDYTSTPVTNGACVHIPRITFTATPADSGGAGINGLPTEDGDVWVEAP